MPRGTKTTDPSTAMKQARAQKSTTSRSARPAKRPATKVTKANETVAAGRKPATPTEFTMREVDELPPRKRAGKQSPLISNLEKLRAAALEDPKKVGRWVEVAKFGGRWSAQNVIRDIRNGERVAPEGIWEFESRISEHAKPGEGPSVLYARYLGEND